MLTEEEKDPARGEEESRDPQAAPAAAAPVSPPRFPGVAPVAFGDTMHYAQPGPFRHPSNLNPSTLPAPLSPFFPSHRSS